MDFDLKSLLEEVKPNILTPHLKELTAVKNDKKAKTMSQLLVRHLHNSLTDPVPKQVVHKGEIHTIRYFDIEPLMSGVWSEMSMILLNLSYAEQCDLIDALYPEPVKLTAKAFAINFTKDSPEAQVVPVRDDDIHQELYSNGIGIAMILATLSTMGGRPPQHPDIIHRYKSAMDSARDDKSSRDQYDSQMTRSQQASKYNDKK